ncbi:MAG: hypothetical protein ACW975_12235 [Candidatus Thorarchaeota archaeon]
MKPLGTITMYFPFLNQETASEVESIMNQAENYYDFVLRLTDRACQDDAPWHLAYLAAIHSWRLSSTKAKEKLLERFSDDQIIKIWIMPQHRLGFERLFAEIELAEEATDEDWILLELLCLKPWYARYYALDERLLFDPLERAEALLDSRSELQCFSALVHTVRSEISFMWTGIYQAQFFERAFDSHHKGKEFANKVDDQFQIYQLLWTCSSWIKTWDNEKALSLQEEAYGLAKKFGAPQKIAEAMTDMGRISEALGEFDLALECYQNSIETYGVPEMVLYREVLDSPTFGISRVYCELGDGESGLEWIDTVFRILGPLAVDHPCLYAQRTEALALLRRYEEAASDLEISHRGALKSGGEGYVGLSDLAAAYLEMAQGDPLTAIETVKPWYEFYSPTPAAIYNNRFLVALTRAEIAANLMGTQDEPSEEWMHRLETHAKGKSLPGIIMLHALLKSDYLIDRGLKEEAYDILKDALMEEHSDTAKTLYDRILNKLEELQNT